MQTLIDLWSPIPFWFFTAFVLCLIGAWKIRAYRIALTGGAVIFGMFNLCFHKIYRTVFFESGAINGVVLDVGNGAPVANASVIIVWSGGGTDVLGFTPVFLQMRCDVRSEPIRTDAEGRFASNRWYGAQLLRGCTSRGFEVEGPGYHDSGQQIERTGLFEPVILRVHRDRKSPMWAQ
jgi:hypothetical protein